MGKGKVEGVQVKDLFLQKVKVKAFASSVKSFGVPPFGSKNSKWQTSYRHVVYTENKNPDEIFTVVGVSSLKEGIIEYSGDEGSTFNQKNSVQTLIVAKSIGVRYKVALEDIILVD